MTITPTAIGDRLAVMLEPADLDELGIDLETRLEMSVEQGEIRIRPIDEGRRELVLASGRKMMEIHADTFRKLAE